MSECEDEIGEVLRRNEEALLDPAIRRDRDRVAALLSEDFVEFGASGRVFALTEILELLATETYQPPLIEDFRCRSIAPTVALVTYRAVRPNPAPGKSAASLRSSVWTNERGQWRMVFHQGTPTNAKPE